MNRETFLLELKEGLAGLPSKDVEERLEFYGEMIDDRREEGLTEETAVAEIGPVDEIVRQIVADTPFTKLVKEKVSSKTRMSGGAAALIILGFPLWFPLLLAAFVIVLALYIVVWAVILSLWAVELALLIATVAALAISAAYFVQGFPLPGLAMLGACLALAGISILFFFACAGMSKGILHLTKKAAVGLKTRLMRRRNEK
ncbi:MAG: DUF1700 domain-containing protein [Lachnospiraceae bacterium]|nr:DUF1700 domain-containing protein [Lachnospiraceae bacterium]